MDFKPLILKTALILSFSATAIGSDGVSDGGGDEWAGDAKFWHCDGNVGEEEWITVSSAPDGAVFPNADLKMSWVKRYGTPVKFDSYMSVGMGTTVGPQMLDDGENLIARYMMRDQFSYTKDNVDFFLKDKVITLDIQMRTSEKKPRFAEGTSYPATVEFEHPETGERVERDLKCRIERNEETED